MSLGYLKDPGDVARLAIAEAKQKGIEVVLVDTAGRMQNNDKLMRELAKLVQVTRQAIDRDACAQLSPPRVVTFILCTYFL